VIEQAFRDHWARVLASLIGYFGDFDLAEEAAAEAFAIAARRWPSDGVPDNPAGWLVTTARHRAIDRLRRDRVLAAKLHLLAAGESAGESDDAMQETSGIPDERLELIFTCCHPALARQTQVALTLRAVAGLTTEEIARAFLVPGETMKRRLSRAKTKIKTAGIPFKVPPRDMLAERLAAVLTVIYLIFNQGYSRQTELAGQAIGLGRVLATLLPGEPEPQGLLALMLLQDSRREARFTEDNDLVLLKDQDRSGWDWPQITEAKTILDRVIVTARGPYTLQAAIAALYTADPPDWLQIAALYSELADLTGSPVMALNRAVAVAEADGPAVALSLVDTLDLTGYQYWHSTRAELLRRLGRDREARDAYAQALALAQTAPERRFLENRIAGLSPS
jgi:RNA polymerase sigma-70 factor, ECF subfamily